MNFVGKCLAYLRTYSSVLANRFLHIFHPPKVGVVVLTRSETSDIVRMTQRCIDSLMLQNRSKISIVVVESGPLVQYCHADVIRPDDAFNYNKFLIYGLTHLIANRTSDFYVVLNNDTLAFPNAIDRLVESGLPSCSPVDPLGSEQASVNKITFGYSIRYHLVGWAICMRSDLFLKVPLEVLFPSDFAFYHQDNFYAHIIRQYGLLHGVVPQAKVVHYEGTSHVFRPDLLRVNSKGVFDDKTGVL